MKKVGNMQEQMDNVSKDTKILRIKREMLAFKNTVPEMMNIFDGLISRLDMAEERISEFEDMSIETFKTKK